MSKILTISDVFDNGLICYLVPVRYNELINYINSKFSKNFKANYRYNLRSIFQIENNIVRVCNDIL